MAEDCIHLLENPDEQDAIRLIRDLRESGLSLRKIGAELGKRGIRTKTGTGTWTAQAIANILNRKAA